MRLGPLIATYTLCTDALVSILSVLAMPQKKARWMCFVYFASFNGLEIMFLFGRQVGVSSSYPFAFFRSIILSYSSLLSFNPNLLSAS